MDSTDYRHLEELLAAVSDLAPSLAEAHGILCALLCAGTPDPEEAWIRELLAGTPSDDPQVHELAHALEHLATTVRCALTERMAELEPMLPDDEAPLSERAQALYDWTRGFLYGLALAGVNERELSAQAQEVLQDFAEITKLDLAAIEEGEEDEASLTELSEFVRVAAMLIYEERAAPEEDAP